MWNFIQNQILGMEWLNTLIPFLLGKAGLDPFMLAFYHESGIYSVLRLKV